MPITEAQRHHLLTQLEATIGKEAAMTLADHLPPVGWADVATKTDLDHLRTEMHREFQLVRAELRDDLHSEIGGLRSEMHAEFARQSRHFTTALLAGAALVISANAAVVAGIAHLG